MIELHCFSGDARAPFPESPTISLADNLDDSEEIVIADTTKPDQTVEHRNNFAPAKGQKTALKRLRLIQSKHVNEFSWKSAFRDNFCCRGIGYCGWTITRKTKEAISRNCPEQCRTWWGDCPADTYNCGGKGDGSAQFRCSFKWTPK